MLFLFTDNFDYQQMRRDFVVGTLMERELGNKIYVAEACYPPSPFHSVHAPPTRL